MSKAKAVYCLIQYCPDLFRGESVNIGVLAVNEQESKTIVRISDDLGELSNCLAARSR